MRAPSIPVVTAASAIAVLTAGCARPEPFFSSDIGVAAIPIERGAHAGTFALRTTNTTQIEIPGIEPLEGGGENFRLVQRTYVPDEDVYEQRSELCGGFNYEVVGVVTAAPESTYREVPASENERVTISDDGAYTATGHVQLWALANLPDGAEIPTERTEVIQEGVLVPPWDERVVDMDADDQPGFTLVVGSGLGSGEIYAVQRKTVDLAGVVLGPDRALGLAANVNRTLTLGANNPAIDRDTEGSAKPHPDPKKSFFEEARLADDAGCDEVLSAISDGVLSEFRPF